MKFKMIVSDFDGTIKAEGKTVSERNTSAIKEFAKRGGTFVIATGRTYKSIKPYVTELGICDYVLPFNGGVVFDLKNQKSLLKYEIENKIAVEIAKEFRSLGFETQTYDQEEIYVNEMTKNSYHYQEESGYPLKAVHEEIYDFLESSKISPIKILCYVTQGNILELASYFNKKYGEWAQFVCSSPIFLECVSIKAGKFNSLSYLREKLGFSNEEVLVLGDSFNDLEMIEKAGMGVAMGNAHEIIKGKAKAVTHNVEDDGVAYAIEKYVLGEE